jgi:hypothetical protein
VKWYLINKGDEYVVGRFTCTRRRNEERHGWRVVNNWVLKPSDHAVREAVIIDEWAKKEGS